MLQEMIWDPPEIRTVQFVNAAVQTGSVGTDNNDKIDVRQVVSPLARHKAVPGSNQPVAVDISPTGVPMTFCGCTENCPPPPAPSNRDFRKWQAPHILAAMQITDSDLPVHEQNWGKLYPKCER